VPGSKCPRDFSFEDAKAFCAADGGVIATITSQAQNDVINAMIKKNQNTLVKHSKCGGGCDTGKKDYLYWIGLQLDHAANGSINGSSWVSGAPVTYGNPQSASFRPPFISGAPHGSVGDGSNPLEACPLGNTKDCVQIYGYGSVAGKWTDKNCSSSHEIPQSCSCPPKGNTTTPAKQKKSSSSEEDDEDHVNACRDEAALNGVVCQYCPQGWSAFQGRCYIAVVANQNNVQLEAACANLNATAASIHSQAENQFVAGVALAASPGAGSYYVPINLVHQNPLVFQSPVVSATWTDGTVVDYANPSVAPWSAAGTYPWAPGIAPFILYPPQPDNRPAPGNCVLMWLPSAGHPLGTWDDLTCPISTNGVVCKN
jgi:hypothetical protein